MFELDGNGSKIKFGFCFYRNIFAQRPYIYLFNLNKLFFCLKIAPSTICSDI